MRFHGEKWCRRAGIQEAVSWRGGGAGGGCWGPCGLDPHGRASAPTPIYSP